MLAMALARTGTTRDWEDICADLHLPASHADQITGALANAQRVGSWPAVHSGLEHLMTSLQQHPPPIDYQTRRHIGDDLALLTAAAAVGLERHPSPITLHALVRQLWERFTGGDIAYAPKAIRLEPDVPEHGAYQRSSNIDTHEVFDVAYLYVQQTTQVEGPLQWTPVA